jgi:PAS domain S-box-containing protein
VDQIAPPGQSPVSGSGEPRENQQRERNALFRLLVESVRDYAIFLLDPAGHILSWNQGAQRIKGYEPDEIIGKHFSIFYPAQDVKRGKPEYELRVAVAEGKWEEEGWRIRKDGSRFWASVVITALHDDSGQLVGFAKVTRDLTERKQAEEERAQLLTLERTARSEAETALEQLRAIQSVTEAALAHLNLDDLLKALLDRIGEILAVDTVAVLLIEQSDDAVLAARAAMGLEEEVERGVRIPLGQGFAGRIASECRPIVLDDVEQADVLNPLLREKGVRSMLGVPLMIQGQVIGVLHVGSLNYRRFSERDIQFLQIVGDRVALAIEHARLIEAARTAQQEAAIAEAAARARDEFLSVAAHELRTPMTSLRMAAELLLRRVGQGPISDPTQLRRALRTIDHQSRKLSRLVTQLLETVRIQAERVELQPAPTNLTDLVAGLVDQAQLQTSRHELLMSAPESVWATVDALRLEQVITNLLDNAIKFTPNGGPIEIELAQPALNVVRLAVRDHGVGVDPAHRPHLFERFYQAHGNEFRSGMGLGLYISRQIVEMHGGTIEVEFPADGGTRFVVELPRKAEEAEPA